MVAPFPRQVRHLLLTATAQRRWVDCSCGGLCTEVCDMKSQRSSVGNERHRKSAKSHPDVAFRELESTRRLGETTQPNRNHECVSHRLSFSVASAFTPSRRLDLPPPHIGNRHTRFHILPRTYSSWALARLHCNRRDTTQTSQSTTDATMQKAVQGSDFNHKPMSVSAISSSRNQKIFSARGHEFVQASHRHRFNSKLCAAKRITESIHRRPVAATTPSRIPER